MPAVNDGMIQRFYRDVGSRVRAARATAGMTQEDLASELSIGRSSIANLEAGRQRIPLHTLMLIADILKVQPAELLPRRSISEHVDDFFNVDEQLAKVGEDSRDFVTDAIAQLLKETEGGDLK